MYSSARRPVRSWARRLLLSLALLPLAAPPTPARADGEPATWYGPTLVPVTSESIRMVRERVVVELSPLRAKVDATFVFENEGAATEQVVAFPDIGWVGASLHAFRTWVDGTEVDVGFQKGGADAGLHYWTVDFPAGSQRVVRVRYETVRDPVQVGNYMLVDDFTYVLTTGARWKGPIGRAEIVLDLVDLTHDQIIGAHPKTSERTEAGYRWVLHDIEPTGNVVVRFHRSPVVLACKRFDGSEMHYAGYPPLVRGRTVLISSRILRRAGRFTPEWDNATKTFTARRGPLVVRCQAGSREAYLGERRIELLAPPEIREGQMMIPIELAEPLGIDASYNAGARTLNLKLNLLNWDAAVEPEHLDLHHAARRYLRSEYEADREALEPRLSSRDELVRAQAHFEAGDIAYYCAEWVQAAWRYSQAADLRPTDWWAKFWQTMSLRHDAQRNDYAEIVSFADDFAEQALAGVRSGSAPTRYIALSAREGARCVTYYHSPRRATEEQLQLLVRALREAERLASGTDLLRVRAQLLIILGRTGAPEELPPLAEALLRDTRPQDPAHQQVWRALARRPDWIRDETFQAAGEMAARLRGTEAGEELLVALAVEKGRGGDSRGAAETYREVIELYPQSPHLWKYLDAAESAYRELGDEEAYRENCWQLITAYPEEASECARRFARSATEEQIRWIAENVSGLPPNIADPLGHRDYVRGDYASALKCYWSQGIGPPFHAYPDDMLRVLMAGLCQLHLGLRDGAAADLRSVDGWLPGIADEILADGPDSEAAFHAVARFTLKYGYPPLEILELGLERYPECAYLHHAVGLGICWEHRGHKADGEGLVTAVAEIEEALRLDPDLEHANLNLSRAYCDLAEHEADAATRRDHYLKAISAYGREAARSPDDEFDEREVPQFLEKAVAYVE